MSDKPMLVGELIRSLEDLNPEMPVVFEYEENGKLSDASWAIDEVNSNNGFVKLKSID